MQKLFSDSLKYLKTRYRSLTKNLKRNGERTSKVQRIPILRNITAASDPSARWQKCSDQRSKSAGLNCAAKEPEFPGSLR